MNTKQIVIASIIVTVLTITGVFIAMDPATNNSSLPVDGTITSVTEQTNADGTQQTTSIIDQSANDTSTTPTATDTTTSAAATTSAPTPTTSAPAPTPVPTTYLDINSNANGGDDVTTDYITPTGNWSATLDYTCTGDNVVTVHSISQNGFRDRNFVLAGKDSGTTTSDVSSSNDSRAFTISNPGHCDWRLIVSAS